MHEGAARRIHELAKDAIDCIVIDEENIRIRNSYDQFQKFGAFLAGTLGEWIHDDYALFYGYISVRRVLQEAGHLKLAGPLRATLSATERDDLARSVCEYWLAVPRDWLFVFPLPGIEMLTESIGIAPGITLENAPQSEVDNESMNLSSPLSGLLGVAKQLTGIPCLKVLGKGVIELEEATEVPAASAIRLAKIVIQLSKVEGVFEIAKQTVSSPRFATFSTSLGLGRTSQKVTLPPTFANALPKNSLSKMPLGEALTKSSSERFSRISQVIKLEAKRRDTRKPPNNEIYALREYQLIQHCARIATASEWLFDAENESTSATTFVQVAIGFETLYGGDSNDPVKQTLSNRVAYSLGKSPGEREELAVKFVKFYDTRSKVVHTGASRLTAEQRQQFEFGKNVLRQCLRHELSLIPNEEPHRIGALL